MHPPAASSSEGTAPSAADRALAELAQEHLRLLNLIDSTQAGTWEWNVQTGEVRVNERWAAILGWTRAELGPLNNEFRVRIAHPTELPLTQELLRSHFAGRSDAYIAEARLQHRLGHWVWVQDRGCVITRTSDGKPEWVFGIHIDISHQKHQEAALQSATRELADQHEVLRVTLQSIGDAVITTDVHGRATWLNPVAERLTGWLSAEAWGRPLEQVFHIVHSQTRQTAPSPVVDCLARAAVVGLAENTLLIARDGSEYGIEDSAAPIRDTSGEVLGVVLVFRDVTEQRRLSHELSFRASHDTLTGLINRGEFELRLQRMLNKAKSDNGDGSQHALLYIDLDQFKLVNDACGHSAGDQLLRQVAKLMGDAVRGRDTLSRLGGDEFAVILDHCHIEQAARVAQQLCDRLDDFRFGHEGRRFRIGASIGLVPLDSRWPDTAALMSAADASCYAAKEAGRNRVHHWFDTDTEMHQRQGQMRWAHRLENALDEDRFVLFAQRIEAVAGDPAALHAEVLLRKRGVDGSLIPLGAFLPAAERFHLCSRIDRWVLQHAVAQMQAMPDLRRLQTLCINLSGQSIGDRAFHRFAIDALKAAGDAVCGRLCLEITETAAVTHMVDASAFIDQVRSLGVRIALDDFGAGASSFGYLKTLKVDLLKIDGQFIKGLIDDPLDAAAVRGFIDVARVVGVKTVAECVERTEILTRVWELGVDYAQGYLLHRPEPIEAVLGTRPRAKAQSIVTGVAPATSSARHLGTPVIPNAVATLTAPQTLAPFR
jgi:diguanylate cyclase